MLYRSEEDVYLIKEFLRYWDSKCVAKADGEQANKEALTQKKITPDAFTLLSDSWRSVIANRLDHID